MRPMLLVAAFVAGCGSDASSSGGTATGTVCPGANTLAPPPVGQTVIEATFEGASADYSGSAAPFTGSTSSGYVQHVKDLFAAYSNDGDPEGDSRGFELSIDTAKPCESAKTVNTIAVPHVRYFEHHASGEYDQWICNGDVAMDAIDGGVRRFHFDVTCAKFDVGITNAAAGTVKVSAKGVSSLK